MPIHRLFGHERHVHSVLGGGKHKPPPPDFGKAPTTSRQLRHTDWIRSMIVLLIRFVEGSAPRSDLTQGAPPVRPVAAASEFLRFGIYHIKGGRG
uniref:Uncharacterized protein n=1 Tax=Zea mays TaxID=4577 RepID=A0A804REW2_MAIZE